MAENIKRHITHIKSKVVESSNPKLPAASQIELGEIAINYAKGYETLSIKNDSGDVVTFSEDKIIGKKGKLTGYAKASSASAVGTGDTINTAIGKIEKALDGKVGTGRKVSAGTGLTGGGDLSADRTISLATAGTAGTYGPAADVTGTNNTTIIVPQITTDAYGRVTAIIERTYTSKDSTYTVNNGTFTVSGNGTSVATMTANQSGNSGVIITGGTNVTVTPDATNHKISISAVDTTYDAMSAAELSAGTATTKRTMTAANVKAGGDAIWQAKGSYLTGTTKYAGSSSQGGAATSANKLNTDAGNATTPVYFSGGVPTAMSYTIAKNVPSNAVFTDTKVTAVGNHYTPTATSADTKSATASSTSELNWGSAVVTGVTLSGDAKGHITSVTVASGKLKTPTTDVSLASGTNNGTLKLTVNGSATDNIAVKGLGTAAYKAEGYFAGSGHTHTNMVTGSSLTANKIVLGNGGSAIKASSYGVETTLTTSSDALIPTSKAIATYVEGQMASALTYKGSISSNDTLKNAHKVGDVYVVSSAGTYAGKACEVGDYIIANTTRASASTVTNADWDAINGENQVDNKNASLAAAGNSATLATVDGTNITVTTPSTWTGVGKTGTVTKISTASGLTGGDITTSGTIGLAATGTPGTYYRVVVDSYGRVTSGNTSDANSWRPIKVNGTNFLTDSSTALNVSGGSNVTVTTGATGLLTIASTYNDSKVEQKIVNTNGEYRILLKANTNNTDETNNSMYASGITVNPSKSEITATNFNGKLNGITPTNNTGTVTSVAAGGGLSGGTITTSGTIGMAAVGTAGTYGPTANVTGTEGTTIKIPQITTDAYGRVTSVTERTLTNKNSTYTVNNGKLSLKVNGTEVSSFTANQSAASTFEFTSGASLGDGTIKVNGTSMTVYTHPTTVGNKHIPSGGATNQFLGWDSDGTAKWVSNPNTDTATTLNGHYTPASSTTITKNASSTINATWGSSDFVTGITLYKDAKGHITDMAVSSLQLPTPETYSVVTTSKAGLAPVMTTTANTIATQTSEFVLTTTSGGTPTWRKLPTTAFSGGSNYSAGSFLDLNGTTFSAKTGTTNSTLARGDHGHASNKVTAMTGYSLPASGSAIATSDTLNAAIGKLEARIAYLESCMQTISEALNELNAKMPDIQIDNISGKNYKRLSI